MMDRFNYLSPPNQHGHELLIAITLQPLTLKYARLANEPSILESSLKSPDSTACLITKSLDTSAPHRKAFTSSYSIALQGEWMAGVVKRNSIRYGN